jgi:glycosyltransferase involved in cell wall biosynthesis
MTMPASSSSERPEVGRSSDGPRISVVVPVYKEEHGIRPFLARALPVLQRLGPYEIIFCLDPSDDNTEAVILAEIDKTPNICLLVLSRRFGQSAATMAGILNCRGQYCVVIDVDLQDPPEVIEHLVSKVSEGYDVVTARRTSRKGETWTKKLITHVGYKIIGRIADVPIPPDTGDFRIMSRRVVEELRGLNESHGFLRGLVSLVGFAQTEILYDRSARHAGRGNYGRYFGSIRGAMTGIFGFSTVPLWVMMWTGFYIALFSAVAIFVVIALKLWFGQAYPLGVPTITVLVLFVGGVQLAAIGVLGEYVGRIYDEVRRRPLYIVDRTVNFELRDPRGRSESISIATLLGARPMWPSGPISTSKDACDAGDAGPRL